MDQYGQDDKIDLLIFTGDLIDYNRNYHPKKFMDGTLSKTGELWQEMFMDNLNMRKPDGSPQKSKEGFIIPNTDTYPSSIDNVIIYSLFLYYYKKYKKPIFLISGNHECYSLPYGISPRVKSTRGFGKAFNPVKYSIEEQVEKSAKDRQSDMEKEKEGGTTRGNRANTGVPADHNLTFSEATLLYGPSYHQIVMFGKGDGSNTRNFKPQNLDWFYAVFSPLSDFSFSWDKQCFIGLEWGDGERMVVLVDSQAEAGGILPRATESLTLKQEFFVKKAVSHNKPCTILLSHFTLVNYDQPIAINKTGDVDFSDFGPSHHGSYDYGTFEKNRKFLYQMLVEKKIHFALAGHSHRSALYQNTDVSDNWYNVRSSMQVNARAANPTSKVFDKNTYNPEAAKIIVSASGGSIPVQNYDNELANWGLANPSGSYVYFTPDGKEQEIGIKITDTSKVPSSKPRLAVALDFADVIGGEDDKIGGVFTRLESTRDDGPIYLNINPKLKLPDVQWIGEVTFYVYDGAKPTAFTTSIVYRGQHQYEIKLDKPKELVKAVKDIKFCFVSINSNGSLNGKQFSHYNQTSPWQFRIKLESRQQRMNDFHSIWQRQGAAPKIEKGRLRGKSYFGELIKMQKENKEKPIEGLYIERHELFGETPKHQYYTDNFTKGNEYAFDWGTGKKSRKKLKKS
jgi:hypothetical protein